MVRFWFRHQVGNEGVVHFLFYMHKPLHSGEKRICKLPAFTTSSSICFQNIVYFSNALWIAGEKKSLGQKTPHLCDPTPTHTPSRPPRNTPPPNIFPPRAWCGQFPGCKEYRSKRILGTLLGHFPFQEVLVSWEILASACFTLFENLSDWCLLNQLPHLVLNF